MEKKNTQHTTGKVAAGVGLAALAAATAGAIFLYGTNAGTKKRKQIKGWSLRMKADVLDRMEKMKDWTEEGYAQMVDTVSEKYQGMKNIDPIEIAAIAADLKRHWKTITREVNSATKPKKKAPAKKKALPKTGNTQ